MLGPSPLPGCSENHGINNPLQSPHPGGLLVAFVDGLGMHYVTSPTFFDLNAQIDFYLENLIDSLRADGGGHE